MNRAELLHHQYHGGRLQAAEVKQVEGLLRRLEGKGARGANAVISPVLIVLKHDVLGLRYAERRVVPLGRRGGLSPLGRRKEADKATVKSVWSQSRHIACDNHRGACLTQKYGNGSHAVMRDASKIMAFLFWSVSRLRMHKQEQETSNLPRRVFLLRNYRVIPNH